MRLKQGQYQRVTSYSDDPLEVAREFCKQGAKMLHVVDLNGARKGLPVNKNLILKIAKLVDIELGGGIRNIEDAQLYLENGVKRVILGTAAIENRKLLEKLLREFGAERILVSLDLRDGKLAINGWLEERKEQLDQVLAELKKLGLRTLIVTDIRKDGMMSGPNFALLKRVKEDGFQVIASGGISSAEDLAELEKTGIPAAVIGKAIYEKMIDLEEVILRFQKKKKAINRLAKRIIPCMDIDKGRVVKGVNFKNLKDAGDPVELAKLYAENGADELVFLDITATIEKRKNLYKLVEKIARNINIPFAVGGGVSSLEDIRQLLKSGADKVAICSAAILNPSFVSEAAGKFGSQCVVISLDCKKVGSKWNLFIKGGRENTGINAISFARKMAAAGAGELLVNSLDRDGTNRGYDLELLGEIANSVNIPVIASSGAGSERDILEVFRETGVDGALAAGLFHSGRLTIGDLKKYLSKNQITIRL